MQVDIFSLVSDFSRTSGNLKLSWTDLVDVLVVALVIYWVLKLIKGTFAVQMIVGVFLLLGVSVVSKWVHLRTVSMLLANFWGFGLLIILIIFQPEIRRTLAQIGRYGLMRGKKAQQTELVEELVNAATALSQTKTGALVVIERNTGLRSHIENGFPVRAVVTSPLLRAIFQKTSPLHDGAVIITGGEIACAVSFLPLIRSRDLDMSYGSRHRAAMGITEDTDAIAVLVSEETGDVHISANGKLTKSMKPDQLRTALGTLLVSRRTSRGKRSARMIREKKTNVSIVE
ncbi:diadenylate cyclase CdaA [bacterium]|nr:diadenylate cyclase CdaA [bacterium]